MFRFIPKRNAQRVFLDYAATTPMSRTALRAMRPYLSEHFANPSSLHKEGVRARAALEQARKDVARVLSVKARDVYFTGGGTESVNLAVLGVVRQASQSWGQVARPHIIITAVEHAAVQAATEALIAEDVLVTVVPVLPTGCIDTAALEAALTPQTVLVAVMYVNNEIGTVQPVREVWQIIERFKKAHGRASTAYPFLYTDASQAPCYVSVQVEKLGADLLTLDGSKMYGPKGVGVLYKKSHVPVMPIVHGGKQEQGLRAGTENVPGIVGFAAALTEAAALREREAKRVGMLGEHLLSSLRAHVPSLTKNGTHHEQVPHIVNVCVPGLHAEFAVLKLDAQGVACTATTACKSNDETGESYVVAALGKDGCAASSLRFSLGRDTTKQDIDRAVPIIARVVQS